MQEEQWDVFLQRLLEGTRAAIRDFAAQHPSEEVCDFAYDSEPCYGYALTCFNTSKANIKHVKKDHDYQVEQRKRVLAMPSWRSCAWNKVQSYGVVPFCKDTGAFEHQGFSNIEFPEWEKFSDSDDYPEPASYENDYLVSRAALIFAQALDTLAEDGSFQLLRLASPTQLGIQFHDSKYCVVRILNLPG